MMQHVRDLSSIHLDSCGLTIGSFDGVHRGHQALVKALVSGAHSAGIPAVVLTFFPHPSVVLRGRRPSFYISTPEEKAELLGDLGVDHVVTQRFDLELSKVDASTYLDRLQTHLAIRQLWVGENFALGHRREGDRFFLEKAGVERGFDLKVVPSVSISGEIISSTRVREALRAGDVARVAEYLGRKLAIPGKVVRGADRGKKLGFPTANLEIWEERAYPGPGVYACYAEVDSDRWKAVTNIGVRPTFEEHQEVSTIEAHLLGFNGDLYHQDINLVFVARLRDERRFNGPAALLEQIERDIRRAHKILDQEVVEANV